MDFDYDHAISNAHLKAAGWKMDICNGSNPFECHFVYIRDYRNDHTQVIALPMAQFAGNSLPDFVTMSMLVSVIVEGVASLSKGPLGPQEMNRFSHALTCYVKNTQSYGLWLQKAAANARFHMIANVYPVPGSVDALLRPMIMSSNAPILTADLVLSTSDELRTMDKRKHPDWFNTKKLGGRR